MKRILFLAVSCILVNLSFAQISTSKVYKSDIGHFSFQYPSYLEQQKINNAPHMLLKLDSKNYTLTLSFWEYDFERSITIWDEDIVSNFSHADKILTNSKVEKSCEKIYLTLANDTKEKCLKSEILTTNTIQGQTIKYKQITYRLLHNGDYLQFVFFVFDYHNYWSKSQFSDEIMKGLKLL